MKSIEVQRMDRDKSPGRIPWDSTGGSNVESRILDRGNDRVDVEETHKSGYPPRSAGGLAFDSLETRKRERLFSRSLPSILGKGTRGLGDKKRGERGQAFATLRVTPA